MTELDEPLRMRDKIDRRIAEVGLREVAVLFVDLVQSTAVLGEQDQVDGCAWLASFQSVVSSAWRDQQPIFEKPLGDGLLACFTDSQSAFDAAVTVLAAMRERDRQIPIWPSHAVRLAVHCGKAILGQDVAGYVVNAAKRVQEWAPPDTLVVTDAVRKRLKGGPKLVAAGHVPIRGTTDVLQVYVPEGSQRVPCGRDPQGPAMPAPRRACVLCERPIALRTSEIAHCMGCGGPVCVYCRTRGDQPEPSRCRACGAVIGGRASEQWEGSCGLCGQRVTKGAKVWSCAGPHCGGWAVICESCCGRGWEFCQEDLAVGLRKRPDAFEETGGLSATRIVAMIAGLPRRLEDKLQTLKEWPCRTGVTCRVVQWAAVAEPTGKQMCPVENAARLLPRGVHLLPSTMDELAAMLPVCTSWCYELRLGRNGYAGNVRLALAAVTDVSSLLLRGGEDHPHGIDELQGALDAVLATWPGVAHVGLFSPTGWEPACWDQTPAIPGGSVTLIAPAAGTTYRVQGGPGALSAELGFCVLGLFDPESAEQKLDRIHRYIKANLDRTVLPPGLTARMVMDGVGVDDPAIVQRAFEDQCRDGSFGVRPASDGGLCLLCR